MERPRAAACRELSDSPPELPAAKAHEVFLTAGFEAAAGWPLPNGMLPVGAKSLGIVMMHPLEWESYRNLCNGERLASMVAA